MARVGSGQLGVGSGEVAPGWAGDVGPLARAEQVGAGWFGFLCSVCICILGCIRVRGCIRTSNLCFCVCVFCVCVSVCIRVQVRSHV